MPCYLYRCDNEECENTVEVIHGYQETHSGDACSLCGSGVYKRIMSAVPFKFAMEMPKVTRGENTL